jgi:hypothetical protein
MSGTSFLSVIEKDIPHSSIPKVRIISAENNGFVAISVFVVSFFICEEDVII